MDRTCPICARPIFVDRNRTCGADRCWRELGRRTMRAKTDDGKLFRYQPIDATKERQRTHSRLNGEIKRRERQ